MTRRAVEHFVLPRVTLACTIAPSARNVAQLATACASVGAASITTAVNAARASTGIRQSSKKRWSCLLPTEGPETGQINVSQRSLVPRQGSRDPCGSGRYRSVLSGALSPGAEHAVPQWLPGGAVRVDRHHDARPYRPRTMTAPGDGSLGDRLAQRFALFAPQTDRDPPDRSFGGVAQEEGFGPGLVGRS